MTLSSGGLPLPAAHSEIGIRDQIRASILIGLCCLVIYNANFRAISAGDAYPARYLPFAILQYHTLYLDPVARVVAQGRGDGAFWMVRRPGGHLISLYPIVTPLLVSPLYIPAVLYLHVRGWTDVRLDYLARVMEKLTASFVASLSAALLYLLLRRRANRLIAMVLTLAYAFGTTTWTISSQAAWQHGMAELLVIAAMLLLTSRCTPPKALAAGLLLGLIAGNRPPDVILAAALGLYGLMWAGRRMAVMFSAAAALPMLMVLFYNLRVAGNSGGGYGLIGKAQFFHHPLFPGIGGLLISPTRGLLVFSPFFLFLVLAWKHLPRNREDRFLVLLMSVAVALQIVLYAKTDFRGGLSWGPRYMTDFLPFLFWMLVPVVAALRSAGRVGFLIAVTVAIIIEAIGAFCYTDTADVPLFSPSVAGEIPPIWQWRNADFLRSLRQGVASADFGLEMRGNVDAIESGGRATTSIIPGQETSLIGWALSGNQTPRQVEVSIDGHPSTGSSTFFDRPDVRKSLHVSSPAGWRIPLDTAGLAPGQHRLTVFARVSGEAQGYFLQEQKLTVRMPSAAEIPPGPNGELNGDRADAARQIRDHQQAAGFWLTDYTSEARFHDPQPEMNTFVTALMVDLLDPLVARSGLAETVQRARKHLTSQIEADGLVRYHGLPDGPGIGRLGCVITPDSDDTALVWRIAPPEDRSRLAPALATIDRYRRPDGLYRSWLAPPDQFQCLDPGSDPNPADIAIQMHLLLLLASARPPAAQALCEALRPRLDDDRIWVYYRKTPLVPILRIADVRRAGCALDLPASRMRADVPGQKVWLSVVRLLAIPGTPAADPLVIREILETLARNGFAQVRTNPPLLYHNDLSASVARYYWSQDVGYALWLRLYDNYEQLVDQHPGS